MKYWPYDEVKLERGAKPGQFRIEAPWLTTHVNIRPEQVALADALADKFAAGAVGPEDLATINWFFTPLSTYPLCYILPEDRGAHAADEHALLDPSLLESSPVEVARKAVSKDAHLDDAAVLAQDPKFQRGWVWDVDVATQFASVQGGCDPFSLFSVARRFHLLSVVEDDETTVLYDFVRTLKSESNKFQRASALMVRQNHYVTERCETALSSAYTTAQSAKPAVQEFVREEFGHDRILAVALKTMATDPQSIPVTSEANILMDLLQYAGRRNFLAFAMIIDFFERSAYQEADPLAKVLQEGGLSAAARQINRHMDINDAGEHENVALGFLAKMAPVSNEYAREAMRLAEVTTCVMNSISSGVRRVLNDPAYFA